MRDELEANAVEAVWAVRLADDHRRLHALLAALRAELAKVIAQADLQDNFRKAGGKPLSLSAEQTRALVRRDVERWTKLVRDIGIKAE